MEKYSYSRQEQSTLERLRQAFAVYDPLCKEAVDD